MALSNWFNPPVIHQITWQAGRICVYATANVRVTEIRITISARQGKMLEQGQAVPVNNVCWEYATTTQAI